MLDTLAHDRMSGLGRQRQVDPCLGLAGQTVQSDLQAPGSLEFLLLAPLPPISFLASFHINPHHISKPCSNFIVPYLSRSTPELSCPPPVTQGMFSPSLV